MNRKVLFLAVTTAALVGCPTIGAEETVGQQFRKVMAEIDTQCKKDKLGPYLDPSDPEYRTKRNQTDCDILNLKPYDPLATPEGRFAHSLKLPPPHDKPKDVYKPGMTGEEYFKALCAAEAGEWVFRRVEGVEGLVQLRRYMADIPDPLAHLMLSEDINGSHLALIKDPEGRLLRSRPSYLFAEIPNPISSITFEDEATQYRRYVRRLSENDKRTPLKKPWGTLRDVIDEGPVRELNARYAFIQRAVLRPNDREHGIRGAELVVVDRTTLEVLGFRRIFARYYFQNRTQGPRSISADGCPSLKDGFDFVKSVVKPISTTDKE